MMMKRKYITFAVIIAICATTFAACAYDDGRIPNPVSQ